MQPWFQRLLLEDVPADFRDNLPELLKKEARAFNAGVAQHPNETQRKELSHWYFTSEAQEQLSYFLRLCWAQMSSISAWAMPAHDARHAMYKVPAAALEYIAAENVPDFERIGIFGALLHDHGRWAEERIFGGPGDSVLHARLSFLLARELAEKAELPRVVTDQILYAVLHHTTGAVPEDAMPHKLTVTADRDQLYGAELVIRLMHHAVINGSMSSVYGEKPGEGILDKLERMARNRLPGPLFARQGHVDELRNTLIQFILMAESKEDSAIRFAPECGSPNAKGRLIANFNWEAEWEMANQKLPLATSPEEALRVLLSAPNLAPDPQFMTDALSKVDHVPENNRGRLAGALLWIHQQRQVEDSRQAKALLTLANTLTNDRPVVEMAHLLLAGWR